MIETVWPWLVLMLLCAGIFAVLERRFAWRISAVMPPIVMAHRRANALAIAGTWSVTPRSPRDFRGGAASYSRTLAPVAVLLALLGHVMAAGLGIAMASVLSTLAPTS